MISEESKQFLRELLEAPSPSGVENQALNVWKKYMDKYHTMAYEDKIGNVAYRIGHGPTTILLSGHIDEVNSRVSYISDKGIISIINTGGHCKKSLLASHVKIMNDQGQLVSGIVEKTPIHCEKEEERSKIDEIYDMKINIGAESKSDVLKQGIHVGSPVIYDRNTQLDFGSYQICSQGLDDKIGVFITYEILKRLSQNVTVGGTDWREKYNVIGMAVAQEETGLRGALVAAKNLAPDISIDFDVTFATDGDGSLNKCRYGDIQLGKGAVIQYGPDKSERLNHAIAQTGKWYGIPYQEGVSRAGGTDTDVFQTHMRDCETTLVSIPNRNMHTPVEVCDWRDVESAVDLITKLILDQEA